MRDRHELSFSKVEDSGQFWVAGVLDNQGSIDTPESVANALRTFASPHPDVLASARVCMTEGTNSCSHRGCGANPGNSPILKPRARFVMRRESDCYEKYALRRGPALRTGDSTPVFGARHSSFTAYPECALLRHKHRSTSGLRLCHSIDLLTF